MELLEVRKALEDEFAESILATATFRGELAGDIPRQALVEAARFCRDSLKFNFLLDISSVDNMGQDPRFEMVYELYSLETHLHLRLKCAIPEDDAAVDSVVNVWPTADWHEREVWDMMGIRVNAHPDLRRILMWEGYPYHPLRKEFPLAGKPSEMPDVAFTGAAPLEGGPFVTAPGSGAAGREPRARGA